ncbi:MAG: HNH endonuclease [Novosphingobium sp.]|nr:HNH endonuclease [Novosphingobium sp.]
MNEDDARFELNRLVDTSDEAILAEIRRVSALIPGKELTQEAFGRHAKVDRTTVTRRFGSWANALNAAGVGHRIGRHAISLSDDEVLSRLRDLATKLGKDFLTVEDVKQHLPFSNKRLIRGWGSTREALKTAGIGTTPLSPRYTDDECFENLLNVWTHYGRPPTYREMGQSPSIVGGKAYSRRFGTWNKALAAFVEQANRDDDQVNGNVDNRERSVCDLPKIEVIEEYPNRQGRRDAPLGLRFKVLKRDNFRCVLCGDNPAKNPECDLHVDHILPWSRGGSTVLENLRTLCANCNLGRSNRYTD